MSQQQFSGYDFDVPGQRRKMKYLVVMSGDLDLNGCYAFKSYRELQKYIMMNSVYRRDGIQAVFRIQDITSEFE